MEDHAGEMDAFSKYSLWDGWKAYLRDNHLPLGPDGSRVEWSGPPRPDIDVVGFAYPLPPVDLFMRNERRFPPQTEEQNFKEAYTLLQHLSIAKGKRRAMVWQCIYDRINTNSRDSPRWQAAFLEAGGIRALILFFEKVHSEADDDDPLEQKNATRMVGMRSSELYEVPGACYSERYLIIAIMGRMAGTCLESRLRLISDGAVPCILKGCRDADPEVQECAICSLKGLVQHHEGRQVVDYQTLMDCLAKGVRNP